MKYVVAYYLYMKCTECIQLFHNYLTTVMHNILIACINDKNQWYCQCFKCNVIYY